MSADGTPAGGFAYPESAARALGLAARRAAWLRRPAGQLPAVDGDRPRRRRLSDLRGARVEDDVWLEPADVRSLLDAYGLPLVEERIAATPAAAAVRRHGDRLPGRRQDRQPPARTRPSQAGCASIYATRTACIRACAEIGGPVVVQRYVTGGVELLVGAVQDPVFGPLVAFGPGGVFAELIGATRFALAPLTDVDADELIASGKAGRLVAGWRGAAGRRPCGDRGCPPSARPARRKPS